MTITQTIITKNDCYKAGRKITPKGLMLHSVGCSQPKASVFINNWNKPGVQVAVHGIIDADENVFQLLPWDRRAWHGGGDCNNTHIGVEMTEPSTIKYTGGASWTDLNPAVTKDHVIRTYKTAVQLFAFLCLSFGLNPLGKNVIISHSEGHALGIASGHGDVEHLWKAFGLTMDGFRRDVAVAVGNTQATGNPAQGAQDASGGALNVGDVVSFAGGIHYPSATAVSGSGVNASRAKITAVFASGKHPYHVRAIDAGGNFIGGVFGWVDASAISKAGSAVPINVGSKVKVLNAVTYDRTPFKTWYDTYDVIQIDGDKAVIGIGKTVTAAVKISDLKSV